MNFFERQDKARRNTGKLLVYFVLGYIMLTLAVYAAVLIVFGITGGERRDRYGYVDRPASQPSLWNAQLFSLAGLGTLAVVGFGSLFKTMELSQGGKAVATMLGGRRVSPQTTDPDERKLVNVVEEMALASGVPVPEIYVMDEENGINAFAAGHKITDAAIGVTRGAIQHLTRDELQGVIAHEFSHIFNGDMRLNIRLIGWIFGIVCLAVIGRVLLHTRGKKNPLPILGLALILIGWMGVFFGRLIQAAVSRQREYLADASAVQFTRNPDGLAGALKKIGGIAQGSRMHSPQAAEASHLFFGNALSKASFAGLMSTHPPLVKRIQAIDPAFEGKFPEVTLTTTRRRRDDATQAPPPRQRVPVPPLPFPRMGMPPVAGLDAATPLVRAADALNDVGTPAQRHIRYAVEVRNAIPPPLQSAAQEPLGATTIMYGLLLSHDRETFQKQMAELSRLTNPSVAQETVRLLPEVRQVAVRAKLPLVDISVPALRELSPSQFQQFRAAIISLTEIDGEIDLFEYVLQKIMLRHLEPAFQQPTKPLVQYYSLRPLLPDCGLLLSALAYSGTSDAEHAEPAFRRGAARLETTAREPVPFYDVEACGLSNVDATLKRLAEAVPHIKQNVLLACVDVVSADGVIHEVEAELLRAVGDALEIPIPPIIARADK